MSVTRSRFLSTPSGWRATASSAPIAMPAAFLSTPSGWRATQGYYEQLYGPTISIHALRVEGDKSGYRSLRLRSYFYPRPPGGGRPVDEVGFHRDVRFLSTPSGWRATWLQGVFKTDWTISIHALRVEGDPGIINLIFMRPPQFLSTPSGWRATHYGRDAKRNGKISIHALRVEGDSSRIAGSTS